MLNVRPPDHLGCGIALDAQALTPHVTATDPADLHPSLDLIHPAKAVVMADPDSGRELTLAALRKRSGSAAWTLIARRGGYR